MAAPVNNRTNSQRSSSAAESTSSTTIPTAMPTIVARHFPPGGPAHPASSQRASFTASSNTSRLPSITSVPETATTDESDPQKLLFQGCSQGDLEKVERALQLTAKLEYTNQLGQTPLHLCCIHGHQDLAELLITKYRANVHRADKDGNTSLHLALLHDRKELAKRLFTVHGANVNRVNQKGQLPRYISREKGDAELVSLLDRAEQDTFKKEEVRRVVQGDPQLQAFLLSSHTKLQERMYAELVLLPMGYLSPNSGKVEAALALGANPDSEFKSFSPKDKKSFFQSACSIGDIKLVELFLKGGASPYQPTADGSTPLHLCCLGYEQSLEIAKLLVNTYKVDVNKTDDDGQTALDICCMFAASSNIAEFLIGAGAKQGQPAKDASSLESKE
jgi:ankyrin repeat protein